MKTKILAKKTADGTIIFTNEISDMVKEIVGTEIVEMVKNEIEE